MARVPHEGCWSACARLGNTPSAAMIAKVIRLSFGVGDAVMERTLLEGLGIRSEQGFMPG
jgi:hypothetical protein